MGNAGLYFGRQDGIREMRQALARKLDAMQLHDDTGDPHDEGYMAAVNELRQAFGIPAPSEQQATPDQAEITAEEAYARGYATRALSAVRRSSPYQSWEHKPLDRAWRDGWEAAARELRSEPTRN